ncbi:MAG: hypothetical protein PHQ65_16800 [Bacteroidales bacterium]|nr:hypothetical protein [Bacteroidales bacterium]MDD3666927.1 hypothetical protein [Bacteroidales bacterium]
MKIKSINIVMCMFATALIMISCSKEKTATEPTNHEAQISAADRAVMQRVIQFRQKVAFKNANPNFKSGEIVAIDSARWDVETNFNATYAFPDEHYLATRHDSAVLFLPVLDDSTTLMDDVLAFNDQVFNQVLALYNSSAFVNRELLFVSLRKGQMAKGELEMKLKVVTGEKQATLFSFTPFGVGDDWKYGDYLGKCDGSNAGTDAAEQLELMLNNNKTTYCIDMPGPPSLYRKIYSDDPMSPYELQGFEYENTNGEYLIYYISKTTPLTEDELCLDYNDMNFHYNGEWEVIYDRLRVDYNRPCNWDFMLCEIGGKRVTSSWPSLLDMVRHHNYLYYSYHYWVRRDCIEDPISLGTISE